MVELRDALREATNKIGVIAGNPQLILFDAMLTSYPAITIAGPIGFSVNPANAFAGAAATIELIANGANVPTFTGIIASGSWANTANSVNRINFECLPSGAGSALAFYARISQPTTTDGGGSADIAAHVAQSNPHIQYRLAAINVPFSELSGVATDAQLPVGITRDTELAASVANYVPLIQRGAVNGVATLDSAGLLALAQNRPSTALFDTPNNRLLFTWADGSTQFVMLPPFGGEVGGSPEVQLATVDPSVAPTADQRLYFRSDNGNYWVANPGVAWLGPFLSITTTQRNVLTSLDALATNGLVERTGVDAFSVRAVTAVGGDLLSAASANAAKSTIGLPLVNNVKLAEPAYGAIRVGEAAATNTLGAKWTAIGLEAGRDNLSGEKWVAIGNEAGKLNIDKGYWTAIGAEAGRGNTGGERWVAIGNEAGRDSTTGGYWTAIGFGAGRANTVGAQWVAIGSNTASANTAGSSWTAIGTNAALSSTIGERWTAVGDNAAGSNTTGGNWTAVGTGAGFGSTVGSGWTAVGTDAGKDNATGSNSVFVGFNTGRGITTGSNNTIVGANVVGLPAALTSNVILASGDGVVKLQIAADGQVNGRRTDGTTELPLTPLLLAAPVPVANVITVPFDAAVTTFSQYSIAGPVSFTAASSRLAGATTRYVMVANGTNVPTLNASITPVAGILSFDNRAGTKNTYEFTDDGQTVWCSIARSAIPLLTGLTPIAVNFVNTFGTFSQPSAGTYTATTVGSAFAGGGGSAVSIPAGKDFVLTARMSTTTLLALHTNNTTPNVPNASQDWLYSVWNSLGDLFVGINGDVRDTTFNSVLTPTWFQFRRVGSTVSIYWRASSGNGWTLLWTTGPSSSPLFIMLATSEGQTADSITLEVQQ